jgi:hypothetical protein
LGINLFIIIIQNFLFITIRFYFHKIKKKYLASQFHVRFASAIAGKLAEEASALGHRFFASRGARRLGLEVAILLVNAIEKPVEELLCSRKFEWKKRARE